MSRSLPALIALAALASLAFSCGSSGSAGGPTGGDDTGNGSDDTGGTVTDGSPTDDTDPGGDTGSELGPYPEGPYGTATGSILADFEMSGYLNLDSSQVSTTAEYKTVKLSDVRAASKVPYLFIHEVGFF